MYKKEEKKKPHTHKKSIGPTHPGTMSMPLIIYCQLLVKLALELHIGGYLYLNLSDKFNDARGLLLGLSELRKADNGEETLS